MNASNMNDAIPFRDRLLTAEQAAESAGIPVRSLLKKHHEGTIPGFHLGGGERGGTLRLLPPRAIEAALAHRSRMPKEVVKMRPPETITAS